MVNAVGGTPPTTPPPTPPSSSTGEDVATNNQPSTDISSSDTSKSDATTSNMPQPQATPPLAETPTQQPVPSPIPTVAAPLPAMPPQPGSQLPIKTLPAVPQATVSQQLGTKKSQPQANPTLAKATAPPPKEKKSKKWILAGAFAALILLIGGIGGFFLMQQNQDLRNQAETIPTPTPKIAVVGSSCTKRAYKSTGPDSNTPTSTSVTQFEQDEAIIFEIDVTQTQGPVPLIIEDDYSQFLGAGWDIDSVMVNGSDTCQPDAQFNASNPGKYRCTWLMASPGATLPLVMRLEPTGNQLQSLSTGSAQKLTNTVRLIPCESCGTGGMEQTGVGEQPTQSEGVCSAQIEITTPTEPTLSCNSACTPGAVTGSRTDMCAQQLGGGYSCVQVLDKPEDPNEPTHRCRLTNNPTDEQCKEIIVINPPSPKPAPPACNSLCTPSEDPEKDECTLNLGSQYLCLDATGSSTSEILSEYRCRLKANPTNEQCVDPNRKMTCNSTCTLSLTNDEVDECEQDLGSEYVCANVSSSTEKILTRCRLKANTGDVSCKQQTGPTATPSSAPSANPSATPQTSPAVSSTPSASPDTSSSQSPSPTTGITGTQPSPTPSTQPVLPQELPQTGAFDSSVLLKVGMVIVTLGAAILLLL
ncbi:MAG: hypothetical protein H6774_01775 [Pseudomonadales bacterium]|nr:hypothetical protein [Candidatus Woesebacteria bacterium]MCB9801795.1 hypothetical protein [Pseudomonadales bacterium]